MQRQAIIRYRYHKWANDRVFNHLVVLFLFLSTLGCARTTEIAINPDFQTPQIFAPGKISTENVFRGTFMPGDQTFIFFKNIMEGQDEYRIFQSDLVDGQWSEPERLNLSGEHSDLYPTVSSNGLRMVFSSYRPVPGDTSAAVNANLWYVDWEQGEWGIPVFMAEVSTPANYDAKPFFGPSGAVYFESTTPDWSNTRSLVTRWDGDIYQEPEVFDAVEQWRDWRSDLLVWGGVPGPDGSFIILDISEQDAETGQSDQWVSFRTEDNRWTEPVLLGSDLNSEGYDNFTFFSSDGGMLFFVRDFNHFYYIPLVTALESVNR